MVRLKDEFSEINDYYSVMFAHIQPFEIREEDQELGLLKNFHDRPQGTMQTAPTTNNYFFVNPDQADHMMVDPAYKLEVMEQATETLIAINMAYSEIDRQISAQLPEFKVPYGKDMYENWWKIEMAIRKFDRWFNRIERFDS